MHAELALHPRAEKRHQSAGLDGGEVERKPAKLSEHGFGKAEHLPSEGTCTSPVSE